MFYAYEVQVTPEEEAKITVEEITIDIVDGKPVLVVKGTMTTNIPCIKLQADADGENYFGDNISTEAGKFEFRFDLTQIRKDGKWAWFHIWAYADANPEDPTAKIAEQNLMRGDFLPGENVIDYDGVRYETANDGNWGLVVFYAKETKEDAERITVKDIKLETFDGCPVLIVKGETTGNAAYVNLQASVGDSNYFGDNVSAENGKFELRFDLTMLPATGEWAWFHIWTYDTAKPANLTAKKAEYDLMREDFFAYQCVVDYNGVCYEAVIEGNWGLVVFFATEIEENVEITVEDVTVESDNGKPVLVVKGIMPTDIACIKLHADADGENYYGNNVSAEAGKFELRFDLTQIRKDGKWAWFHIYTYDEAEPTDNAAYSKKIDLNRNEFLPGEHSVDYDGVRYEIANDSENSNTWNMICFYANQIKQDVPPTEEVTEVTVKEITLEMIDGKAYLIVKGVMPTDIACIKIHADGNDGDQFFGDNVSTEAGKFELRFDLTQTPLEGTPWLWFHIYTYAEAEPADQTTGYEKIDLQRGDMLKTWQYIDCGEVRYKVQENSQLVIKPNAKPMAVAESMSVEVIDGKLTLVVKGTMPEEVPCIKIHAWANGDYYGDNVSTEAGKFELHFDLTQVSVDGTPWMWFHLYIYKDAEPTDLSAKALEINLDRGTFFEVGQYVDFNGVRYEVENNGQLAIQPSPAN